MCGIAGVLHHDGQKILENMLDALAHRGPDDCGTYHDRDAGIFLGHRRLSIIDLSQAGHQPMSNADASVWVVFNGEIYNYQELSKELKDKGYIFTSTSDTEVIIHGYEEYGADIFKKIDGMWAIALYDKQAETLILSRDPAGMKPLYYFTSGTTLIFSSEINALAHAIPHDMKQKENNALKKFLLHGYIFGEDTIYKNIKSIPLGTTLSLSLPHFSRSSEFSYQHIKNTQPVHELSSMKKAVDAFEQVFEESVRDTLYADVPVALFLSGGIDSGLVGRALQKRGVKLHSFTIGFEDKRFDESSTAERIAHILGFPHTTIPLRASDVALDITSILDSFGQPFADMSMIPTYYLSKYARSKGYKVALTGDGADELFGGYPTHFLPSLTDIYKKLPQSVDTLLLFLAKMLPSKFSKLGKKEKIERFLYGVRKDYTHAHAAWKHVFSEEELNDLLIPSYTEILKKSDASFEKFFSHDPKENKIEAVMHADFMTFLSSSCLVKSDIASMQHGLELRMPFLNKKIIDFARSLPTHMKVSPFRTKKILRKALKNTLPSEIIKMPKAGFVPPLALWLTEDLKPVMLDILSEENVAKVGFLQYNYVSSLIDSHITFKRDNAKKIWALMSLVRFYTRNL